MPAKRRNILSNSFKTFESLITQWRMFSKMTFIILFCLFLVHCSTLILILKYRPDMYLSGFVGNDFCIFRVFSKSIIRSKVIPFKKNFSIEYTCEGKKINVQYERFRLTFSDYYYSRLLPTFKKNIIRLFLITSPVYFIYAILLIILSQKYVKDSRDKFLRGKLRVSEEQLASLLKNIDDSFRIRLNEKIFIPEGIVTKHCFAIGATGSGKSQLAFRIVEQLIRRNVRCIIHDFKGDFIPAFFDQKKHYIFNPLDIRHMGLSDPDSTVPKGWTIFNELETLPNVDSFTSSMIPDGPGDPIWYTAPRDLLKAMIIYCIKNNLTSNNDLNNLIETSPDTLRNLFESTPGCKVGLKHLEEGKLAGQFMSILATYTASLSYLVGTDGNFSIRKWINEENSQKRIIFLSNQAEVQKTLKTLISTFFDFSTKAMCTLPDDPDGRRLYFILDEFGQLSKMDSVVQLLTQGRSKGAATWLFIQDISQIDNIYGKDLSKSIVNGCRNKFYFNVSDHYTADFISKEIGSVEFERTRESKSFGIHDLKDSINIQNEIVERPIAIASEISSQENLTFYMQLADISKLTQIKIDYQRYPSFSPSFIPRDIRVLTYGENERKSADIGAVITIDHNQVNNVIEDKEPAITLFQDLSKQDSNSDNIPNDRSKQQKNINGDDSGKYQERVKF